MSGCEEHPRWRANELLFLHLIDIKEGGELPLRVVSDDGVTGQAHFRCRRASGSTITLESDGVARAAGAACTARRP